MMQLQINFIRLVNFYSVFLLLSVLCKIYNVSADSYNQNYENQPQNSDFAQQSPQPIKPIGGYGHPKLNPRFTQEQIELSNPYLVNGNDGLNQINCEGINCQQQPISTKNNINNIDQPIYNPYNYIQETATNNINKKLYNNNDNMYPYDDNVNSMIDRQHHQIVQQQQQQPSFKSNIESNLQISPYQNHFFNLNQQSQNTFNQEPNQQHQTHGIQMENSNYKVIVPHVSNNNVDINFILEQQYEHLRVLLYNIKQQQLKLMQTIMDIQRYVQNIPSGTTRTTTTNMYWPEKQIENQQHQTPINLDIQQPVVGGTENIVTTNNNGYFNDLSKTTIQNQQSGGLS